MRSPTGGEPLRPLPLLPEAGAWKVAVPAGAGRERRDRPRRPAPDRQPRRPQQAVEPEERCEFCAVDIGERHGHVADLQDHRLLCVCRPCYLLFGPRGSGGGRYRGVGEEVRRVDDLAVTDAQWDALKIPVDLVFFFRQRAPTGC